VRWPSSPDAASRPGAPGRCERGWHTHLVCQQTDLIRCTARAARDGHRASLRVWHATRTRSGRGRGLALVLACFADILGAHMARMRRHSSCPVGEGTATAADEGRSGRARWRPSAGTMGDADGTEQRLYVSCVPRSLRAKKRADDSDRRRSASGSLLEDEHTSGKKLGRRHRREPPPPHQGPHGKAPCAWLKQRPSSARVARRSRPSRAPVVLLGFSNRPADSPSARQVVWDSLGSGVTDGAARTILWTHAVTVAVVRSSCSPAGHARRRIPTRPSRAALLHDYGRPGPRHALQADYWRWSGSRPRDCDVHAIDGGQLRRPITAEDWVPWILGAGACRPRSSEARAGQHHDMTPRAGRCRGCSPSPIGWWRWTGHGDHDAASGGGGRRRSFLQTTGERGNHPQLWPVGLD
jgi:hypothetical protein